MQNFLEMRGRRDFRGSSGAAGMIKVFGESRFSLSGETSKFRDELSYRNVKIAMNGAPVNITAW
jgi:hypothetical protein